MRTVLMVGSCATTIQFINSFMGSILSFYQYNNASLDQFPLKMFLLMLFHRNLSIKTHREMDVCTNFDTLVREMEWGDVVSTIEDVLLAEMKVEAEGPLHSLLGLAVPGPAVLEPTRITAQQTDILNERHCGYEHRSTVLQYFEEPSAPEAYIRQAKDKDKNPLCSQNAIRSQDLCNQEVGCHPGQVKHNLHSVKCLLSRFHSMLNKGSL